MTIMFHAEDIASALHDKDSLAAYLTTKIARPDMMSDVAYAAAAETDRAAYNRARCLYASGGIVMATPHVMQATELLTDAFAVNVGRNSGHVGLLLDGDSTVGKTETTKTLMRTVFSQYTRLYPKFHDDGIIPVVFISVPAVSTGKLLMQTFADFLHLPYTERDSMGTLRSRVVQSLKAARTQLIVVDELQNLVGRSAGLGESVDVLKNLHNEVSATFVYAGFGLATGDLLAGARGQQLRGRFTILSMDRLNLSDPADKKTWKQLINGFEKKLPLHHQVAGSLWAHNEYLYMRTSGSIGSLAKLLALSTRRIIDSDTITVETITQDVMDTVTLDVFAEENYKIKLAALKRTSRANQYPISGLDAA
jgi:hypothetical protein